MIIAGIIVFAIGLLIINMQLKPTVDDNIDQQLARETLSTVLFASVFAVLGFVTAVTGTLIQVLS